MIMKNPNLCLSNCTVHHTFLLVKNHLLTIKYTFSVEMLPDKKRFYNIFDENSLEEYYTKG